MIKIWVIIQMMHTRYSISDIMQDRFAFPSRYLSLSSLSPTMPITSSARKVVVTGIGAVTPLGNTFLDSWNSLLNGNSGATSLDEALRFQGLTDDHLQEELNAAKKIPCQVAAPVRIETTDKRTPRFVDFALRASRQAMEQADLLHLQPDDGSRVVGVCIGTGMSSVREVVQASNIMDKSGIRRISPHFVPKVLANSAAGRVAQEFNLHGPNHCVSTACAAASHSIGDAMRFIEWGAADVMLAGGTEACIDPLSMAGFSRLRALSTQGESVPFDQNRDGFIMAEGSCIMVLEELEHAVARGARILARVAGYGLSGDAFHTTSPDPQGRGAQRAMRMALADQKTVVDYVNAHATSTPKGDEIEARAIQTVLGDDVRVSSTKGATGHLLGAAGAIEAAFTIQSLVEQIIPPTRMNQLDPECDVGFQHVIEATPGVLTCSLSNSFGFGGTNASLLFEKMD